MLQILIYFSIFVFIIFLLCEINRLEKNITILLEEDIKIFKNILFRDSVVHKLQDRIANFENILCDMKKGITSENETQV